MIHKSRSRGSETSPITPYVPPTVEQLHTPRPHLPVHPVPWRGESWHSVWLRKADAPSTDRRPLQLSTKERSNETCSSQSDAQFRGGGLALRRTGSVATASNRRRLRQRRRPRRPQRPLRPARHKATDITVTGCLIQGSAPNVWVLENAKMSTAAATDKGKSYVVVVTGAADLKPHLNHQVRIVGAESAASRPPAPSARRPRRSTDEASFPKLNARTVTMVANTCPA